MRVAGWDVEGAGSNPAAKILQILSECCGTKVLFWYPETGNINVGPGLCVWLLCYDCYVTLNLEWKLQFCASVIWNMTSSSERNFAENCLEILKL